MTSETTAGRSALTGIALRALARHWNNSLSGGHIQTLRQVGEEQFVLKIRTREQNVEMLIQLPEWIMETARKWTPLPEQASIVNATKEMIDNAKITSVKQHGLDRILIIECEKVAIIIELFGGGNILAVNPEGKIAFVHHAREWKGRILKKGHAYKFPSGPTEWNELPAEKKELEEGKTFSSLGGWMVSAIGVPPAWVNEIVDEIKRKPADEIPLSQKEWASLRAYLQKISEKVKKEEKFVIQDHAILPAVGKKTGILTREQLFARMEEDAVTEKQKPRKDSKREAEIKSLEINLSRQEAQVGAWENKIVEAQHKGEWIYANFGLVEQLIEALKRAKKQKVPEGKALQELKKKIPTVKRVDWKSDEVELEIE